MTYKSTFLQYICVQMNALLFSVVVSSTILLFCNTSRENIWKSMSLWSVNAILFFIWKIKLLKSHFQEAQAGL